MGSKKQWGQTVQGPMGHREDSSLHSHWRGRHCKACSSQAIRPKDVLIGPFSCPWRTGPQKVRAEEGRLVRETESGSTCEAVGAGPARRCRGAVILRISTARPTAFVEETQLQETSGTKHNRPNVVLPRQRGDTILHFLSQGILF